MELSLNEDQVQILDFIDSLTRPYASVPMHDISFALTSEALDQELVEGGFLDVMAIEELGPVTAALVVGAYVVDRPCVSTPHWSAATAVDRPNAVIRPIRIRPPARPQKEPRTSIRPMMPRASAG